VGIHATSPEGPLEIRADLVIGADGRHSTLRAAAGLEVIDFGVPIDVLWMRLSRRPDDPNFPLGRVSNGHLLITLNRGDYWQCAFVIRKGGFAAKQAGGLAAFRAEIAATAPPLADRVGELVSWDQVKLLTVSVDRLKEWARPGLLCIGDAAHAMSPIGGVGINLAIQDAVAAANILVPHLLKGDATLATLQAVERRRRFPTVMTQRLQVFLHNHFLNPLLAGRMPAAVPRILRLAARFPFLTRIPARVVGVGFRPEHVHTPDAGQRKL
jgi:2-polyprenyl-6-methoxyphenol hydroxylase-like FAD-dependent oxidoreductase